VQPVVGDGLLQAIDELKSGHPKALQLIGEAVSEAEQGHTEKAIDLNLEAIEISPGLAQAYVNLLILYGQEKRFEEADKIYKKGIEAAPNFGKLYYNYGVLLLERNRPVEAYDVLLKAIQVNPLNASARINLGRIEEMKGDLSEAERQYREAISAKPDLRLAHFNLARMLIARNQPSEGAAELEKLRTPEDDQTPLYLYALSAARVREGQLEEALEVAEEARTLAEKYNRDDLLPAINRDLAALRAKLKK
jgi:Tfp pilus assembly protein PilF